MTTTTNRETWLNDLAKLMAPKFEELGKPVKPFRVSIGFTGGGKSSKAGAEVWHSSQSADGKFEIFIKPSEDAAMTIAAYLAHELCHVAAGFKAGHKGAFADLMRSLGLQRPYTHSIAGPDFEAWVTPMLASLGPLPHGALQLRRAMDRDHDGGDGEGADDDGEGGSSNDKKKQSTRMLKAACTHQVVIGKDGLECTPHACGYTVRLSKKWAESMGAMCPAHGPMEIDGLEPGEDEGAED